MAKKTTDDATTATDGRAIGKRAMATRRRLLESTADLLERDGLLDLKLVDITREIGASPATFYQYFTDIDDALLCLCEEIIDQAEDLLDLLVGPWEDADDFPKAQAFVDAYLAYWDENGAVLRVRNLKAEEGDKPFRNKRRATQLPMLEAMAELAEASREAERLPADADPIARAAAMLAMLERLSTYQESLSGRGTTRASLRATLARILFQTLVGIDAD